MMMETIQPFLERMMRLQERMMKMKLLRKKLRIRERIQAMIRRILTMLLTSVTLMERTRETLIPMMLLTLKQAEKRAPRKLLQMCEANLLYLVFAGSAMGRLFSSSPSEIISSFSPILSLFSNMLSLYFSSLLMRSIAFWWS